MRPRFVAPAFLVAGLASATFGQQAKLEGHVFDDKKNRVSGARIVAPGGQATDTDSNGHFTITFPSSFQPGQATRIEVRRLNWVVLQPMNGDCNTQNSRNFQPLKVIIVPKGSPLALSPNMLRQAIARWSDERIKHRAQVGKLRSQLDEYAFLKEYSERYGFTLADFRAAAQQWAQFKDSDDKEERAVKEYFLSNYERAAQLGLESAIATDPELEQANKQKTEVSLKQIRRFKLAGNAFYEQNEFRKALAAYNEIETRFATRKYSEEDLIGEWADVRILRANTKLQLAERVEGQESQSLLSESVEHLQEALEVFTREQSPQEWGVAKNSLGIALQRQAEKMEGGMGLLALAVEVYREALMGVKREQLPRQWAGIQLNLGSALAALGGRLEGPMGVRLLAEAIATYDEALKINTREHVPQNWATIQHNLGLVMTAQATRLDGADGMRALAKAVGAYREALRVFTREQHPEDWAMTQSNLGDVLRAQGERLEGREGVRLLELAVEAHREALNVYTREHLPQYWATTQNNLGIVLFAQGERLEGTEGVRLLTEAVAAHREALRVFTREHLPQDWAMTQTNLGGVLSRQAKRLDGPGGVRVFVLAVDALRQALEVYTHADVPLQWAATQSNLGLVLTEQADRLPGPEGEPARKQAIEALREALRVHTLEHLPQDWAMTQTNLGNVLLRQGESLPGAEGVKLLTQAILAYREALKVYKRDELPQQWAMTQNNIGAGLMTQAERLEAPQGVPLLTEAVAAFLEALKVRKREQLPQDWAVTQNNLAGAYLDLRSWPSAAESYGQLLMLDPDNEVVHINVSVIYHEKLFKFEEAYTLNQQWIARHPQDLSAQVRVAEQLFTTGRFAECAERITALLTKSEVPGDVKTALRAIEIADLLALERTNQVRAKIEALIAEVSGYPNQFKIERLFEGVRHFMGHHDKLTPYRTWLVQLFDALEGKDRETVIIGLRQVAASFKK